MADTYLTRAVSSTGNQKIWTWSAWIKRGTIPTSGNQQFLFSANNTSNYTSMFFDNSTNRFNWYNYSGGYTDRLETNAVFRDPAAWYHFVVQYDSTQSTEANRVKLYINGSQITDFATANYPTLNYDSWMNLSGYNNIVGRQQAGDSAVFDGYMSEVHLTDGTSYAASTFGETDTTGVWVPKVGPTVTYGTNGFYLKFANSGAMGTDSSGNSNTFSVGGGTVRQVTDTPTNVFATINSINASSNITISKGNLQTTAVAAWYSAIGTIYATSGKWYFESVLTTDNWVMVGVAPTSQDINVNPGAGAGTKSMAIVFSTDSSRGDIAYNNVNSAYTDGGHGIDAGDIISIALDLDNNNVKFYKNNTQLYNLSNLLSDEPYTFAVSHYNGSVLVSNFGQDGTFSGNKTAQNNADGNGKGNFYYAPPTGFLALCTDNLSSELTIPVNKGADNFNPVIYTGTGSSQSLTGVGFQPDFTWIKSRSNTHYHDLFDSVRGATKVMYSNADFDEDTEATSLTSFDSDGFTAGGFAGTNGSSKTYVAWNWKAGGTAPTNTYAVKVVSDSGNKYRFDDYGTSAITLELQEGGTFTFDQSDSSNAGHPLRFSSTADGTHGGGSEYTTGVTTTGTPGQAGAKTVITVAGSAPTLYYYCTQHSGMGGQANTGSLFGFTNVKGSLQSVVSPNTTAGFSIVTYTGTQANATVGHGLGVAPKMIIAKCRTSNNNWPVYHASITADKYLRINTTAAESDSNIFWNDTEPTNSVFSVGVSDESNKSGGSQLAYCFAEVEGFSKFGKYAGNGSTDGPFVYTGFRPAWVMVKAIDHTIETAWNILDSKRNTYNPEDKYLNANDNDAEATFTFWDFTSNGFKIRNIGNTFNVSSKNFIYMAFAENPFVTSTGKPVTAR